MKNFPEKSGDYWAYLTEDNVKFIKFPKNKYVIVKVYFYETEDECITAINKIKEISNK